MPPQWIGHFANSPSSGHDPVHQQDGAVIVVDVVGVTPVEGVAVSLVGCGAGLAA